MVRDLSTTLFLENNIGGNQGVQYRSKMQEIIRRYF
jgi:hypothetical protein